MRTAFKPELRIMLSFSLELNNISHSSYWEPINADKKITPISHLSLRYFNGIGPIFDHFLGPHSGILFDQSRVYHSAAAGQQRDLNSWKS